MKRFYFVDRAVNQEISKTDFLGANFMEKIRCQKCGNVIAKGMLIQGLIQIKCRKCKTLINIKPNGAFAVIGQKPVDQREIRGNCSYKKVAANSALEKEKPCEQGSCKSLENQSMIQKFNLKYHAR